MHGIIFSELQKYADGAHGKGTWENLLKKAGLEKKFYLPVQEYPDAEAGALVMAASSITGHTVSDVLQDFGEFIVPSLLKMYGHLMKPEWKTIDVIERTEATVHAVVRIKNPGARPPQLRTKRISPDEVVLIYTSPRRMCALAIGIGKGLGNYFHEKILINQIQCMHKGAPCCEISFRKTD